MFSESYTMHYRRQRIELKPSATGMFTPLRPVSRVSNDTTNWFQCVLDIFQHPPLIAGYIALIGVLLCFLGEKDALLPVNNQVVNDFLFVRVIMLWTPKHKFGDNRNRKQCLDLQLGRSHVGSQCGDSGGFSDRKETIRDIQGRLPSWARSSATAAFWASRSSRTGSSARC